MRVKINKEATKVEDGPHELTNITVKEVSVVDRAANQRKFLVTKNAKNRGRNSAATTTDEDDIDLNTLPRISSAELAEKTETQKAAEALATATASAVAAPVAAPVDALKALDALAVEAAAVVVVTPVVATAPTKKDDLPVAVTIVAEPEPLSPSAEALKSAILAGIDLITTKVGEWRKAVEAADKTNTDVSGRPYCTWEYSYYLTRMINNLSDIGGPEWDVLNATIGKATTGEVTKANKAITAARIGVLKGIHDGIQHCAGGMSKVMKELTDESADEIVAPDASSSFAKADGPGVVASAHVVAAAPAIAAPSAEVSALVTKFAELSAKVTKSDELVSSLRSIVQAQATELAKSRTEVSSNALSVDNEKVSKAGSHNATLEQWPDDLAPPRSAGRNRPKF